MKIEIEFTLDEVKDVLWREVAARLSLDAKNHTCHSITVGNLHIQGDKFNPQTVTINIGPLSR